MTEPATTWLPNLVGGVSIWKLARDLNEPHLFDGRLLVPDAEGPDSLPTRVTWSLAGLLPLGEARASAPADTAAAIADFLARLEKVGLELKDPASGFHRFKDAFTVPGLEADGGAHYYYDPVKKKLSVINWGASPRAIAGAQSLVFGWQSFDKVAGAAAIAGAGAIAAGAAAAASSAAAGDAPVPATPADARSETKDAKVVVPLLLWGRPWWHWLLVLLAAAAMVLLVLYLLRACNEPAGGHGADGGAEAGEAGAEGASGDASGDASLDGDAPSGEAGDALADGAPDGATDGRPGDASTDGAPDGSADGASDGASDARSDGSADARGDSKGDGRGDGGPGDLGVKGGGGAGGHGVVVGVGPGGGPSGRDPNALPHRFHFEPEAVHWKVTAGQNMLDPSSPLEGSGQNFEVILKPGGSFDGVKVEWQDGSGHWHH